jgi:hypothetical protein
MLFGPELDQAAGDPGAQGQQPVDTGVAGGADSNEPFRIVEPRLPMMDMEGPPALPCPTDAAPPVALEDPVAVSAEPFPGVRPGPVAGWAQAGDGWNSLAAGAKQGAGPLPPAGDASRNGSQRCERGHHRQEGAEAPIDKTVYHKLIETGIWPPETERILIRAQLCRNVGRCQGLVPDADGVSFQQSKLGEPYQFGLPQAYSLFVVICQYESSCKGRKKWKDTATCHC